MNDGKPVAAGLYRRVELQQIGKNIYTFYHQPLSQGPLWWWGQWGHGPTTFLRVEKIKTHNKLSVECSPFKTKKNIQNFQGKLIYHPNITTFWGKSLKKQATPIPPPEKNKVTLVIYFCEKTLPLYGKKA